MQRITKSFALMAATFLSASLLPPDVIAQSTPPPPSQESPTETGPTKKITIDTDRYFADYARIKGYPVIPDGIPPSTEPAPGQKLIEWARPPILDYEIPARWSGYAIACDERDTSALMAAAATCAPLLAMAKLFTKLDFAVNDARTHFSKDRPRADASRAEAIAVTDEIIARFAKPQYPLQYMLLARSYERRAELHKKWGALDAAIADQDAVIRLLSGPDRYGMAARVSASAISASTSRAQAYLHKSELLLDKKDRAAAKANYQASIAMSSPKDLFVIFSPDRRHSEMMVKDAIFAREDGQARLWVDEFITRYGEAARASLTQETRDMMRHQQLRTLLSYKLYIAARTGDSDMALETLGRYALTQEDRKPCVVNDLFPYAIAPLHKNPAIAAELARMGCTADILAKLDDIPTKGVQGLGRSMNLPPHK